MPTVQLTTTKTNQKQSKSIGNSSNVIKKTNKNVSQFTNFQFKQCKSISNPHSIHGIYPYRGKISAIDAQQTIKQFTKGATLLDPFCGSGTIVYEGMNNGLNTIGVDLNPIAIYLAKGKINVPRDVNEAICEAKLIIEKSKLLKNINPIDLAAAKHFESNTIKEIARVATFFENMTSYTKACFLGTIALTARGCNHYKWTSSTVGKDINPKRYINFYDKFIQKIKKHHFPVSKPNAQVIFGDARKLTKFIKPETVDFVFTSPPYFNCLDYTAYYAKIIYKILGYDRLTIKKSLIQTFKDYKTDMKKVLEELYKVCKKDAKIIFVVGDKKIHGKIINGGEFFNSISPFKNVQFIERSYSNSSSQIFDAINKTNRKEQIVIWKK